MMMRDAEKRKLEGDVGGPRRDGVCEVKGESRGRRKDGKGERRRSGHGGCWRERRQAKEQAEQPSEERSQRRRRGRRTCQGQQNQMWMDAPSLVVEREADKRR
jgi:hypothetical protein